MYKWLLVPSLTLVLVAGAAGPALAEDQPSWDPSVGYNPAQLDEALRKAWRDAGKETAKEARPAFAPTAPKTTGAPARPSEGWQPYQHPQPVGN